jgi:hypothetical protein
MVEALRFGAMAQERAPDRRCTARLVVAAALTLATLPLAAGASAAATPRDPHTTAALLRIARAFNRNYSANRVGAVYDRWDARSRRIISRAEYVRRHRECRTNPGAATIEGAARAGSWWLVHYSISEVGLTDYWRYEHGRWVFDLVRSNPQAVRLYRLSGPKYVAAIGCTPGG